MSGLRKSAYAAALCFSLCSAPLFAESLEDAEKKIIEAYKNTKSCSAKMKMTTEMATSGMTMKQDLDGSLDWSRQGDQVKFRTEFKGAMVQNMGGNETKSDVDMTAVYDGQYMHTLMTNMGQTMAMKQKLDPKMASFDAEMTLKQLKEQANLTLLADEKVDGRDCYVIEATMKAQDPMNPMAKQKIYFTKDSGTTVKMLAFDKDGKTVMTMDVSDVKLNQEIPADRFVLAIPEGVQVMDMTGGG